MLKKTNPMIQVYDKMIDMIKEGKWCKDAYDDGDGHHCFVGLYHHANPHTRRYEHAHTAIDTILSDLDIKLNSHRCFFGSQSITDWNDDPETTEEDVISLIETLKSHVE